VENVILAFIDELPKLTVALSICHKLSFLEGIQLIEEDEFT
jgi:hypothetical protein